MYNSHYQWKLADDYGRPQDLQTIMDLDREQAWCGPYGDPERVIEDDIMGKPFSSQIKDLVRSYGIETKTDGRLLQAVGCPFLRYINALEEIDNPILIDADTDLARIIRLPENETYQSIFAAIINGGDDDWRIRGLILDCDISVDKHHRNLGLGSGLVAAQIFDEGGLKVWDHDKHGFSTGGKACALRGLHLAQSIASPWLNATPEF
jgi:hypothetical protein